MLLAIGMTLVIATGGVDLSVGAVMAISASVAAHADRPGPSAVIHRPELHRDAAAARRRRSRSSSRPCAACGTGCWSPTRGIQPMVATLILMIAGRGIAQLITNGVRIQIFYEPYAFSATAGSSCRSRCSSSRACSSSPGCSRAGRRSGCSSSRSASTPGRASTAASTRSASSSSPTCSAASAPGIAGIVASSNIRTSDANNIGLNFELDAILAVVIGGTLLTGGRFSLLGSIVGALVIQAITTSMYAVGVPANALLAIKGFVVIVVILLFSVQVRRWMRRPSPCAGRPRRERRPAARPRPQPAVRAARRRRSSCSCSPTRTAPGRTRACATRRSSSTSSAPRRSC